MSFKLSIKIAVGNYQGKKNIKKSKPYIKMDISIKKFDDTQIERHNFHKLKVLFR